MALIICPECNKEISDKSEKCIHCGYPLNDLHINYICKIDDIDYDLKNELDIVLDSASTAKQVVTAIMKKTSLNMGNALNLVNIIKNTKTIPKEFQIETLATNQNQHVNKPKTVTCPYCKSTNTKKISGTSRWMSTGIFGLASGKIGKQWRCTDCKSDF